MGKTIMETSSGYVTEDEESGVVKIYTYSVANYDGFIDKCVYEDRYNYKTGLYQSWHAYGYKAGYHVAFQDREYVMEMAQKKIGYKKGT